MSLKTIVLVLASTTALAYGSLGSPAAHAFEEPQHEVFAEDMPDLSALRYFAQKGQHDRYRLELRRLVTLYPDFVPPQELFQDTGKIDRKLWDVYATGDFALLESEIARTRDENPYWRPNPALLLFLRNAEKFNHLATLSEAGNFEAVIDYSLEHKGLLKSGTPEVVWAVGEALAQTGNLNVSSEAFQFGVDKNKASTLLPILVQKASQSLPPADAYAMYTQAQTSSLVKEAELDMHFVRGLVLRTKNHASRFPDHLVTLIETFGKEAHGDKRFEDLQNLAWAYYAFGDYGSAARWFSHMPKATEYAKSIEGEALSLKHLGKLQEALKIAEEWRDASDGIAALYVNLAAPTLLAEKVTKLDPTFLERYTNVSNRLKSGEGAEALGWYAYKVRQYHTARAWFERAAEWELTETAAFGLTLTTARLEDRERFDALKLQYSAQFPKVASLEYSKRKIYKAAVGRVSYSAQMAAAHKQGKYEKCLTIFNKLARTGNAKAYDHQMHGWCLMKLDRPEDAQRAFASAKSLEGPSFTSNGQASLYGAALAALRAGRTLEADRISQTGQLSAPQLKTIRSGVLAQQALDAFRKQAYAQTLGILNARAQLEREPANLTELRGWSLFKLGNYREALKIFELLDATVSSAKTRQAVVVARRKIYSRLELD